MIVKFWFCNWGDFFFIAKPKTESFFLWYYFINMQTLKLKGSVGESKVLKSLVYQL